MVFRRCLIATICCAGLVTPVMPQTLPSSAASTAHTQAPDFATPTSLRAALRAWKLDRPVADRRFTRTQLSNERAVYENLDVTDQNYGQVKIGTLTLTRQTERGPTFGQLSLEATDVSYGASIKVAKVSMSGVISTNSPLAILNTILSSNRAALAAQNASNNGARIGSITLSGLSNTKAHEGENTQFTASEATLTNVVVTSNVRSFDSLNIKDIAMEDRVSLFKIAALSMNDIGAGFWDGFSGSRDGAFDVAKLGTLTLGGASIDGISISAKPNSAKPSPFRTISLANFTLKGLKDGNIDLFGFTNFSVAGGAEAKAWQGRFASLRLEGINTRYFAVLGEVLKSGLSSLSRQGGTATTAPSALASDLKLNDVLTGGPLDSGIAGLNMSNFSVEAAGLGFGIDQIALAQKRDAAGIITAAELLPMQMRLTARPSYDGSQTMQTAGVLASIASQNLVLKFSGLSTFSPQTDVLSLEKYEMELVDWGSLNMTFAMTGLNEFMRETTIADFLRIGTQAGKPRAGNSAQQLRDLMSFYRGIALTRAQLRLADLGGVERSARIFASGQQAGRTSAASAPPTTLTPAQVNDIRVGWASPLRAASGNKNKPALERMFSISVARFLESGDTIILDARPQTPVVFSTLQSLPTDPIAQFGLRVSNQPKGPR